MTLNGRFICLNKNNKLMKILAIIPARIGSKGVPLKNIQKLNGIPLIEHTLKIAKKVEKFDKIIVSTDSEKIANIARQNKIEIPFIRPKKLSGDKSSSAEYVTHALNFLKLKMNYVPDIITILQPTSPIRDPKSITDSIAILKRTKSSCVMTVTKTKNHPFLSFRINKNKNLQPFEPNFQKYFQRQKFPILYYPTGSVYTFWRDSFEKNHSVYGNKIKPIILKQEDSVDIDSIFDLFIAEMTLKHWKKFQRRFKK
jgi:CMP-N-acetylneuraminic acid synthetase